MPAIITNFPLVAVSDVIISFLQYIFGNAQITPSDFRWNSDGAKTNIFIAGPYTITREKLGAAPSITVARTTFNFQNRVIDNLEAADPITHENPKFRDLMEGNLNIICEAEAGPEATGLANFVATEIQANRRKIAGTSEGLMHKLTWASIGPETPVKEEAEITRWQCVLTYRVMLNMGWVKKELDPQPFKKMNIYAVDNLPTWESSNGEQIIGSPNFVDNTANFGFLNTDNPKFLESEFNNGWYYVNFADSEPKKYTIEQIINNKTLKLSYVNADGDTVDFNPGETQKGVTYKIEWNSVHVNIEMPKKN